MSRRGSVLVVVALAAVTACSSASTSKSASDDASSTSSTTATTAGSSSTGSSRQVSANDATMAELVTALTDAGVPQADRWAREVDEYRPYPTDDPTFAKLRQELSKYNPSTEVVDQIVGALSLP